MAARRSHKANEETSRLQKPSELWCGALVILLEDQNHIGELTAVYPPVRRHTAAVKLLAYSEGATQEKGSLGRRPVISRL